MISLDEAIKHAREVADKRIKESIALFPSKQGADCVKCANEELRIDTPAATATLQL